MRAVAIPVILLTLYFLLPFRGDKWPVATVFGLASVGAVLPLTVKRIARIRSSPHPLGEALVAISLLSTLVIVGFATAYYAIATNSDQIPALDTRVDSLYFTITTMSTVGYGDIVATGQGARALVTFHIVVNLTLIAGGLRLVAGAARETRDGVRSAGGGDTPPAVDEPEATDG